ncbi:hypothetical protein HW537_14800 [Asaia siamensis]
MIDVASLWSAWSGPIWAGGGAIGMLIRARLQRERNHIDMTAQALALVEASKKTLAELNASAERSLAFELAARVRDASSLDALADIHVLAIGARLRCHDVEYRAGLPLTSFPPFPAFPVRRDQASATPEASDAGGKAPAT